MKFKGIKDAETRIEVWGWMDDVIHAIKPPKIAVLWENNGIPRKKGNGNLFTIKDIENNTFPLTYSVIDITNKYWYEKEFANCDWNLVCETFAKTMSL